MEDTNKEYDRVLSNPDNLILSDSLQDILMEDDEGQFDESRPSLAAELVCNEQTYLCKIKKITRKSKHVFDFKVKLPTFPVEDFIEGNQFELIFHETFFSLEESPNISFRDTGILTFSARRIINNEKI